MVKWLALRNEWLFDFVVNFSKVLQLELQNSIKAATLEPNLVLICPQITHQTTNYAPGAIDAVTGARLFDEFR